MLGKKLLPDGQPTPDLVSRMKKATAVYRAERLQQTRKSAATTDDDDDDDDGETESEEKGKGNAENNDSDDVVVIVTGGATVTDKNTESVVMKRLLVELVRTNHLYIQHYHSHSVTNIRACQRSTWSKSPWP